MTQPAWFSSRRRWLQGAAALPFGAAMASSSASPSGPPSLRGPFALDDTRVQLRSPAVQQPINLLFLADTHLSRDDARGEPFREFSKRMAGGYQKTRHFKTGAITHPEEGFQQALQRAKDNHARLLVLGGDIFSFPSEAAIEWVHLQLKNSGIPYLYTAGNHDWHYEGMPGSSHDLRAEWTQKRLTPLYQGDSPLMASREIDGVRLIAIDNSTYEIQPEQLDFFRRQNASGLPLVLFVHIPLYAPGRPVGFGCGHPQWGAATDRNFEIERRPRWPEAGHTETTVAFHREVFASPNLLGVFAGHTHQASLDVVNGIPQFVTTANANAAFLDVHLLPLNAS